MTNQYGQPNINVPAISRLVDSDARITTDDDVIDIVAGDPTLELPDARTIPSKELLIKSTTGTGTVIPLSSTGQTIDGAGSFTFSSVNEPLLLKSNGQNWLIASASSGAAGGTLEIQEDAITVDPDVDLINFTGSGVSVTPIGPKQVEVTISGAGIPSGADIPEGTVLGSPGDLYQRVNGDISSLWQYLAPAPGVTGWRVLGPFLTGAPVGVIDGANQTFAVPGGLEAVDILGATNSQVEFLYNGVNQVRGVDYITIAGSIAGVTISAVEFTSIAPLPGDQLSLIFVPA